MSGKNAHIFKLLRGNEWWNSKTPFGLNIIFATFYLNKTILNWELFGYILLWLLALIGIAGFGYFINDCFDIENDLRAGKKNIASALSFDSRIAIICGLLFLGVFPWLFFPVSLTLYGLVFFQLITLAIYAIPPFRLKDKRFVGILADVLYAFVFPFGITYTAFNLLGSTQFKPSNLAQCLFFFWIFLVGTRNILKHHLEDKLNDYGTRTYNLAHHLDLKKIQIIIQLAELICLLSLFALLPGLKMGLILVLFFLLSHYLLSKQLPFFGWISQKQEEVEELQLNILYEHWFPVFFAIAWLQFSALSFAVLLAIWILFDNLLIKTVITQTWQILIRVIKKSPFLYNLLQKIYRKLTRF
ncbi:MAG: hypothetical protein ACI85I_000240 [Arenicella sp.]|jgi:hypothetical protein